MSSSSLPTAIDELPSQLNFTGLIVEYEELQLVGWQKEVLLTLSEGCIETIRLSMWLNHENPLGFRPRTKYDLIGQLVHVKHVAVTSFDFTNPQELQFYGEIRPATPDLHTLLVLVGSGGACARYEYRQMPLAINTIVSVIPSFLKDKNSVCHYPIFPADQHTFRHILQTIKIYRYCLSKDITFSVPENQLQHFINRISQNHDNYLGRLRRESHRWVLSYEQQRDWENKQLNKETNIIAIPKPLHNLENDEISL